MIVEVAERDPVLLRRLDVAAAVVHDDDGTLRTRLRKAIDAATRTPDYLEYSEVAGWASNVDASLDAIADLASGPRAGLALELAEHAIGRIERAIDSIDDSDGYCSGLLYRARDIHLAAAESARTDAVQLARNLFARQMDSDYDTFEDAVQLYADVLGESGLAEYHRLAARAWEKLPQRSGGVRGNDDERSADEKDDPEELHHVEHGERARHEHERTRDAHAPRHRRRGDVVVRRNGGRIH